MDASSFDIKIIALLYKCSKTNTIFFSHAFPINGSLLPNEWFMGQR